MREKGGKVLLGSQNHFVARIVAWYLRYLSLSPSLSISLSPSRLSFVVSAPVMSPRGSGKCRGRRRMRMEDGHRET